MVGGDLAQRPWYMRLAIWIAALGLLGGMAYGALHLTRKLRAGEAALTAPIDDDAAVDDATAR